MYDIFIHACPHTPIHVFYICIYTLTPLYVCQDVRMSGSVIIGRSGAGEIGVIYKKGKKKKKSTDGGANRSLKQTPQCLQVGQDFFLFGEGVP